MRLAQPLKLGFLLSWVRTDFGFANEAEKSCIMRIIRPAPEEITPLAPQEPDKHLAVINTTIAQPGKDQTIYCFRFFQAV